MTWATIRQVVIGAEDLDATSKEIREGLGLSSGFADPLLEDIGLADVNAVNFVMLTAPIATKSWDAKKLGQVRLYVANMITILAEAKKCRTGDYMQAAVGLRAQQENYKPPLPDFAHDHHTRKGKSMGRGVDHFVNEGAKLVPAPKSEPYKEEAIKRWKVKHNEV